eukprot:Hpha_TRINITY_DN15606_c1_g5::TRINITY_DN15606_c1_g5_i2::g.100743::m.100743
MGNCCSDTPEQAPAAQQPQQPQQAPTGQQSAGTAQASEGQYAEHAQQAVPAEVYMISGCQDKQTSADVSNVASFGLPSDCGPGGAGGACTNALLAQAYKPGETSWIKLLDDMRGFLSSKGYSQVPQLSTSKKTNLKEPFAVASSSGGRKLAALVGINYRGQRGELSGCVNDVVAMKNYLVNCGYSEDESSMRICVDVDHSDIGIPTQIPTKDEIYRTIDWLVSQARSGDSLFFHYSGHGGQQRDTSGDEEDGMDETLIPVDYQSNGVITDDELFEYLVAKLPKGVHLVCLMDCCHSGTILDLPYTFIASGSNVQQAQSSGIMSTLANPAFQTILKKLVRKIGSKYPAFGKMASLLF